MGEKYFNLKKQLEQLGYNKHLPTDAVPLVECLTADLLQTTRSLQNYMQTAQDALRQRDDLVLQAEPYKCDNSRLLKENNHLNQQIILLKEESIKMAKESSRRIKSLSEELCKKDEAIIKLKTQTKDTGLRGVYAGTLSSRNKVKPNDKFSSKDCNCATRENVAAESQITGFQKEIGELKDRCSCYSDEIALLQKKVEHRDNEIARLNLLLEGGRPVSAVIKECGDVDMGHKVTMMYNEYKELEAENAKLMKQLDQSVAKQHEAMLRALSLADKNKLLEEELSKLDKLALRVEDECNNQIKTKNSENIYLRERVNELLGHNNKLKLELAERRNDSIDKLEKSVAEIQKVKDYLNSALKEKDEFLQQIKSLQLLNSSLQEKLTSVLGYVPSVQPENDPSVVSKLATKEDLRHLWEKEKQEYQSNCLPLQKRMADALECFNKRVDHMQHVNVLSPNHEYIHDLYCKIREAEHKLQQLEKENIHLKTNIERSVCHDAGEKIDKLKVENNHLKKENAMLICSLSYQNQGTSTAEEVQLEKSKSTINKLHNEVERLLTKNNILKSEKKELNTLYKEALNSVDNLRKELANKDSQLQQLEESSNFRMSSRSGRGSVDHLRDECYYLREQMLKMQSELIKEKTLVTHLKDSQSEIQRSTTELQDELLNARKQLSHASDNCRIMENKFKELQAEILSLRIEKSKLMEDLRNLDQDRDKMVIEIDKKSESLSILEQKMKLKTNTINQLESEVANLKQELIIYNSSKHIVKENEIKINFLNSEIQRLKEQNEHFMTENKHLQSSLANANTSLKTIKSDFEHSQKDADGLRLQLQHYVAEVKRIEDLLSHKEAERADLLENFGSLSVEANILENTNQSLENESVSKSIQLQDYKSKVEELKEILIAKDKIIDTQSANIASLSCKSSSMENEIRLITEEKADLKNNNSYLKDLCHKLESEKRIMGQGIQSTDSELQLYEDKMKKLTEAKADLEIQNNQLKATIKSVDKLLSSSRREVLDLKLALQDATSETKTLKDKIYILNEKITEGHAASAADPTSSTIEMGDIIRTDTQEENMEKEFRDSESIQKRSMKYSYGSTL